MHQFSSSANYRSSNTRPSDILSPFQARTTRGRRVEADTSAGPEKKKRKKRMKKKTKRERKRASIEAAVLNQI